MDYTTMFLHLLADLVVAGLVYAAAEILPSSFFQRLLVILAGAIVVIGVVNLIFQVLGHAPLVPGL